MSIKSVEGESPGSSDGFEMEEANCPLCDSGRSSVVRHAKDRIGLSDRTFSYVECSDCGLVYQSPRVTPQTVGHFYPNTYYESRPGRNTAAEAEAERREQAKCVLVESMCPQRGRLLEVGSANGDFLIAMRSRGWEVSGVEVSGDASEFSRREHDLEVFNGELFDRPDDGQRFDLIVMWAVLPHISDPKRAVSMAASLLAENGKLFICCANMDSFAASYMKDEWGHMDAPRHYCMWGPDSLRRLYDSAGLKIDDIAFDDDIYIPHLILRSLYPLVTMQVPQSGITPKKIIRRASEELNSLLVTPLLAWARSRQRGAIVATIGSRKDQTPA